MKGTWPKIYCEPCFKEMTYINIPAVTTALNSSLDTRSISSSICCSVDDGEFRMVYVETGPDAVGGVGDVIDGAGTGGGKRENSDGDGAMKDKY